ncbi:MAG: uridine kinase [Candidatus Odinarchaeota archaeon]
MLGDVLLITEKHMKAAKQVIERLHGVKLDKYIIAVGGESGSGKSEVSHLLSKLLKKQGIFAKILHTDNYYKILPRERTEWRKKQGIEKIGHTELDWDLINQNIEDFKENREAKMPCVDLLTDQVDTLITNFDGINVLILDGLYCLKADVDLKIHIDLTYQDTKKAQIARGKELQTRFRLEVLKREHEVVQLLKKSADLLITRDFDVIEAKKD